MLLYFFDQMVKIRESQKGKTLRERSIFVYLESEENARKWKELSKKAGTSISKFVIEHVENSLRQDDEKSQHQSRKEIVDELRLEKEKREELEKRCRMLEVVVDRYEKELQTYRMKPWADENYRGLMKVDTRLIKEFQKRKEIRKEMVYSIMKVDPSDKTAVNALDSMIKTMELLSRIKDLGGKWIWIQN